MGNIRWPGGKSSAQFIRDVVSLAPRIRRGRVLVVDPASGGSSQPGVVILNDGEVSFAGILELPRGTIHRRLATLADLLRPLQVDTLVIERIRGRMSHDYLKWAIGATIAAVRPIYMLEMPPQFWHKVAPDGYEKSDEGDARLMAETLMLLVEEFGGNTGVVSAARHKGSTTRRIITARTSLVYPRRFRPYAPGRTR